MAIMVVPNNLGPQTKIKHGIIMWCFWRTSMSESSSKHMKNRLPPGYYARAHSMSSQQSWCLFLAVPRQHPPRCTATSCTQSRNRLLSLHCRGSRCTESCAASRAPRLWLLWSLYAQRTCPDSEHCWTTPRYGAQQCIYVELTKWVFISIFIGLTITLRNHEKFMIC